jgi:hypothetical protein
MTDANPMCAQPGCGRRKFEHYTVVYPGREPQLICRKWATIEFTPEPEPAVDREFLRDEVERLINELLPALSGVQLPPRAENICFALSNRLARLGVR